MMQRRDGSSGQVVRRGPEEAVHPQSPEGFPFGQGDNAPHRPRVGQEVDQRAERSEEHTSELQSLRHLVCRLLLEKKQRQKERHEELSGTKEEKDATHFYHNT